jgi:hypothetical protein
MHNSQDTKFPCIVQHDGFKGNKHTFSTFSDSTKDVMKYTNYNLFQRRYADYSVTLYITASETMDTRTFNCHS